MVLTSFWDMVGSLDNVVKGDCRCRGCYVGIFPFPRIGRIPKNLAGSKYSGRFLALHNGLASPGLWAEFPPLALFPHSGILVPLMAEKLYPKEIVTLEELPQAIGSRAVHGQ